MTLSTSTTYTIHNDNAPDETIVIRPVAGEPGLLEVIRHHGARLPACLILSAQAARMLAVYLEKAAKDADSAMVFAYKVPAHALDDKRMAAAGGHGNMAKAFLGRD